MPDFQGLKSNLSYIAQSVCKCVFFSYFCAHSDKNNQLNNNYE